MPCIANYLFLSVCSGKPKASRFNVGTDSPASSLPTNLPQTTELFFIKPGIGLRVTGTT